MCSHLSLACTGPLTLVAMNQDQCDMPASPPTLPEFPTCFTATAQWQSTAPHKHLAALQNIPHAFCPPNSYPLASQVPADFPFTADLVPGYKS